MKRQARAPAFFRWADGSTRHAIAVDFAILPAQIRVVSIFRVSLLTVGVWALLVAVAPDAWAQQRVAPQTRQDVQLSFAPVVKRAAPAVVNIYTGRNIPPWMAADPRFRPFFSDQTPTPRVQNSLGSGVIVDPSGLIVTNNHVIAKADEIKVILADRREFDATVL